MRSVLKAESRGFPNRFDVGSVGIEESRTTEALSLSSRKDRVAINGLGKKTVSRADLGGEDQFIV